MMTKTLDLRDYPRAADGSILTGESGSHATTRESHSHVASHDSELAPLHIRAQIWKFAALAGGEVSRAQIAKGINRKKAGWIDRHIEQLVQDRWLDRTQSIRPNGAVMFWYKARRP
jgi:hypothetical protein